MLEAGVKRGEIQNLKKYRTKEIQNLKKNSYVPKWGVVTDHDRRVTS